VISSTINFFDSIALLIFTPPVDCLHLYQAK
jgi:hypothetical protein